MLFHGVSPWRLGVLVLLVACAPSDEVARPSSPASLARSGASFDTGGASFATATFEVVLTGTGPGEAFGSAVAGLGDVDGDGVPDVAVGAPDVGSRAGRVVLFSGATLAGGGTTGATVDGTEPGARLGEALSRAGDVDADGYADALVAAPRADGLGAVLLLLGGPAGLSATPAQTLTGSGDPEEFGAAVSGDCDVDGDGLTDVLVGAPRHDWGTGRAYLFLGTSGGFAAAPGVVLDGPAANAAFGTSVACAGDLDGDGYDDLAVGAPATDTAGSGSVSVYLGGAGGPAATPSVTLTRDGRGSVDGFGAAVAAAGDVDGDGYDDLVVGAPQAGTTDAGAAAGWIGVFTGGPGGPRARPTYTAAHERVAGQLGAAVAGVGDVNVDGFDDLLAGAPEAGGAMGAAGLFFGSASGPAASPRRVWTGDAVGQRLGWAVAGAGDLDADGWSDLLVAAPGTDASQGAVRVAGGSASVDADGDGWSAEDDCDDTVPEVNPGAVEVCDDRRTDEDCDGLFDDDDTDVWGQRSWPTADLDGDRFRGFSTRVTSCLDPLPSASDLIDCDDTDPSIHPHAHDAECNGIDEDCDGVADDDHRGARIHQDADGDGFGLPGLGSHVRGCGGVPAGYSTLDGDCDDADPTRYPGAFEECDGLDNDCDEVADNPSIGHYEDADGDGYGDSLRAADSCGEGVRNRADCDDADSAIHAFAVERCDGVDNDCDGEADEGFPHYYADGDGDGQGAGAWFCVYEPGAVTVTGDCDDADPLAHSGATEICDGVDQDCDGHGDRIAGHWVDADDDGYGNPAEPADACVAASWTTDDGDCDDADGSIHPLADERCDGVDNDCDAATDEGGARAGYYRDADGDGFGGVRTMSGTCRNRPEGYTQAPRDCEDTRAEVNPDAVESCDGIDNDCDGRTDVGPELGARFVDADGDGWGDAGQPLSPCDDAAGTADRPGDCDDGDASVHPTAADTPDDGVDADCDGSDAPETGDSGDSGDSGGDKPPKDDDDPTGCGCASTPSPGLAALLLAGLALLRRRSVER